MADYNGDVDGTIDMVEAQKYTNIPLSAQWLPWGRSTSRYEPGDGEKGGKGSQGKGSKGKGKGADAIELVQGRYTGIVRSVGTTQKGIDGLIEIDQDDKTLEPRYIHYHSLN